MAACESEGSIKSCGQIVSTHTVCFKRRPTALHSIEEIKALTDLTKLTRRKTLLGLGAGAGALAAGGVMPGSLGFAQAQSSAPIKIGFQKHAT